MQYVVKGNVLHYHIVFINRVPGCDRVAINLARVIDFPYLFLYIRREMRGAAGDISGCAGVSKESIGTPE
jgi:hypothetical protein